MDKYNIHLKRNYGEEDDLIVSIEINTPYESIKKIMRLIIMLVADQNEMEDMERKIDAIKLVEVECCAQSETLSIRSYPKEKGGNAVIQIELGAKRIEEHSLSKKQVLTKWIDILSHTIESCEHIEHCIKQITHTVNGRLSREWEQKLQCGLKPTAQALNYFMLYNSEDIYTREQLAELYRMCGSHSDRAVTNLISRTSIGDTLLITADVYSEIRRMKDAIKDYAA